MAKSATELKETEYAHPEVLVDTAGGAEHANDPKVKLVEVDVDTSAYDSGHVKGAIGLDWRKDLQARPVRTWRPKTSSKSCPPRRASATRTPSSVTATTTTGLPPGSSGT